MIQQNRHLARLCFLIASLAVGCAHHKDEAEVDLVRLDRARPPAFLTGPATLLLTNTDGFMGSVAENRSFSGGGPKEAGEEIISGELLGRGSKFFFVPEETSSRKGKRNGGVSFIWDAAESKGYVLSEALQGYAPISSSVRITNLLMTAVDSIAPEKIAGHICYPKKALAAAADGLMMSFELWRAPELRDFPLRVGSTTVPGFDLRFSRFELRVPPNDVFSPPQGFTRYESLESMMNELAARQHDIRRTGLGPAGPPPELQERGLRRPQEYRP